MSPFLRRLALAAALGLVALPAQAHLVQTGFGAFYDGFVHLTVTPADLLLVVALGLLAGLRGIAAARFTVLALPAAWLVGGLLGQRWPALAANEVVELLPFLLTGALVAVDARLRPSALQALVVGAGLIHGAINGATMAPAAGSALLALAGAVNGVVLIALLLSAEVTRVHSGWPRVVVRVLGSWITATGMLMFGWMLHAAR